MHVMQVKLAHILSSSANTLTIFSSAPEMNLSNYINAQHQQHFHIDIQLQRDDPQTIFIGLPISFRMLHISQNPSLPSAAS